jgi:16S rRNA (uracil1498-N3)-methyltransferase
MRAHYTLARLYIDAPLSGEITLEAEPTHYLTRVMRLGVGDAVRLFNGRDGEVCADITHVEKKTLTLTVTDTLRPAYTPPPITLFFAPLKRHRTATLLEKATELGVTRLQPVITARTQFPKLNLEKMRAQIIEAAEQTERLDLPQLDEAKPLIEAVSDYDSSILMGDEGGDAAPMLAVLEGRTPPLGLLIGPEGGWSSEEREALRALDHITPISLGPRILRADTAAISMLSLAQAALGDWRDS